MIDKKSKIFKGDIYCDEKGLIFEAYNIENIDSSSCRVIFFDWLISLDQSIDPVSYTHLTLPTSPKV